MFVISPLDAAVAIRIRVSVTLTGDRANSWSKLYKVWKTLAVSTVTKSPSTLQAAQSANYLALRL
jgi:hypothetical protein